MRFLVPATLVALSIAGCGGSQELTPGSPIVGGELEVLDVTWRSGDCNANGAQFQATASGEANYSYRTGDVTFKMRQVVGGVTREIEGSLPPDLKIEFASPKEGHFLVYRELETGRQWKARGGQIQAYYDYSSTTYFTIGAEFASSAAPASGGFAMQGNVSLPTKQVRSLQVSR